MTTPITEARARLVQSHVAAVVRDHLADAPAHVIAGGYEFPCACGELTNAIEHHAHIAAAIATSFPQIVEHEHRWRTEFSIRDRVILTGADWPDEQDHWVAAARGSERTVQGHDEHGRPSVLIDPDDPLQGVCPIEYVYDRHLVRLDRSATLA